MFYGFAILFLVYVFLLFFFNMYWGYSRLLMDVFAGMEKQIASMMHVFTYSVAASISSLVFSEVEAEVVCVKSSLKSIQLVCWL